MTTISKPCYGHKVGHNQVHKISDITETVRFRQASENKELSQQHATCFQIVHPSKHFDTHKGLIVSYLGIAFVSAIAYKANQQSSCESHHVLVDNDPPPLVDY
jgi:hypothetical protein